MIRTLALCALALPLATACNGNGNGDGNGNGNGNCGTVDSSISIPADGWEMTVSGDVSDSDSGTDAGYFNIFGDVGITLGSEVGDGLAVQFTGLDNAVGTYCAESANLFVDDTEYRNGEESGEEWTAAGDPVLVEISEYTEDDVIAGRFSGTFIEDADGNTVSVDIEGGFTYFFSDF